MIEQPRSQKSAVGIRQLGRLSQPLLAADQTIALAWSFPISFDCISLLRHVTCNCSRQAPKILAIGCGNH